MRALTILAMLCMAACGFEPLQGQAYRSSLTADLSSIAVSVSGSSLNNGNTNAVIIPRRYGELLKAEIEDSVNPNATQSTKQFDLTITFTESDIALFVNPDGTASRGNLDYLTSYSLRRIADGKVVASGSIRRVSSYNSSPTADFASYISIEDARKRAMQELAQDYKLRLAALLPTLNDSKASIIEAKPEAPKLELQPLQRYEVIPPRN